MPERRIILRSKDPRILATLHRDGALRIVASYINGDRPITLEPEESRKLRDLLTGKPVRPGDHMAGCDVRDCKGCCGGKECCARCATGICCSKDDNLGVL